MSDKIISRQTPVEFFRDMFLKLAEKKDLKISEYAEAYVVLRLSAMIRSGPSEREGMFTRYIIASRGGAPIRRTEFKKIGDTALILCAYPELEPHFTPVRQGNQNFSNRFRIIGKAVYGALVGEEPYRELLGKFDEIVEVLRAMFGEMNFNSELENALRELACSEGLALHSFASRKIAKT